MEYRNRYIKEKLQDAFRVTEGVKLPISIWVAISMAPELLKLKDTSPPEHMEISEVGLGPTTRNERVSFFEDYLLVWTKDEQYAKIPYQAILFLVAPKELNDKLGWEDFTIDGRDLAYVHVMLPEHDVFLEEGKTNATVS